MNKKSRPSSSGFSLVEVLMGCALLAVAITGMMTIVATSANMSTKEKQRFLSADKVRELREFMSVEIQCNKNFSGQALVSAGGALNPTVLPLAKTPAEIVDSNDAKILVDASGNQTGPVTFDNFTLDSFKAYSYEALADKTIGTALFKINARYAGQLLKYDELPLMVSIKESTGEIQSCFGASNVEKLWNVSGANMFSMSNSLGIGTPPVPGYAFSLNGDFAVQNGNPMTNANTFMVTADSATNEVSINTQTGGWFGLDDDVTLYCSLMTLTRQSVQIKGCGTVNPASFSVAGDGTVTLKMLKFEPTSASKEWKFELSRAITSIGDQKRSGLRIATGSSGDWMQFNNPMVIGNPGAGAPGFYVDGKAGGPFAWAVTSDARLKENVVDFPEVLDVIKKLEPVRYEMKNHPMEEVGFIAQDLPEELRPVLGKMGEYNTIRYAELIPALTKGLQEIDQHHRELREQVNDIKKSVCLRRPELKACHPGGGK